MNGGEAKVFVITGPSGVGKGTLIAKLLERVPDLELSVSATTRQPREGAGGACAGAQDAFQLFCPLDQN